MNESPDWVLGLLSLSWALAILGWLLYLAEQKYHNRIRDENRRLRQERIDDAALIARLRYELEERFRSELGLAEQDLLRARARWTAMHEQREDSD